MTQKIRVLQILTRLVVRGVPRHVLDLTTHLDKERFEVEVLAGRGEENEGSLWEEAADRGVVTHRVDLIQRDVNPVTDFRAYRAIYRHLKAGNYDVVHTHISKAGFLGRLAAKRAGVPLIVHTYHGSPEELVASGFIGGVFRMCERRVAELSDVLVAISCDVKRRMIALGIGDDKKFRVIPNGIDLTYFDPDLNFVEPLGIEGHDVIGFVGSLTDEKGLDILLRAMPEVAARHPKVKLWVVGDGPLRKQLEALAASLGLSRVVCFHGNLEDIRPWLAALDLLVLPSRSEGMGRVLLEAMAMGITVIASRVGGVVEVVRDGETGVLVNSEDPKPLATAIESLLRDADRRKRLANNGLNLIRGNYSLGEMVTAIGSLYEAAKNSK